MQVCISTGDRIHRVTCRTLRSGHLLSIKWKIFCGSWRNPQPPATVKCRPLLLPKTAEIFQKSRVCGFELQAPDQNEPIRDELPGGFSGVSVVTVRLMSDGELTRFEVLRDLDRRRLTSEAAA